jgi:hypothetical protein
MIFMGTGGWDFEGLKVGRIAFAAFSTCLAMVPSHHQEIHLH